MISPFHAKAKLWVAGRKNVIQNLVDFRKSKPGKLLWFHCASLGEFEQGRPIMEAIKKEYPDTLIALTFFSPSGYEIRKNYTGVDWIGYLPNDTSKNATNFIEALNPSTAIFVKYEYWPSYFLEIKKKRIPLYVVSAILRPDQRFFGIFKGFWKKILNCVDHFFVQNDETKNLLSKIGFNNTTLAGDNRFDRVIEIANNAKEILEIKTLCINNFTIVAGSTWPQDEEILIRWLESRIQHTPQPSIKLILVPHEINKSHIDKIINRTERAVLWSERDIKQLDHYPIVVIDSMGMLSSIYQYATVTYVGGGFGKGIHNTLEAAVWSKPLLFGPNIQKFEEAKTMVKLGGAMIIRNYEELEAGLDEFITNKILAENCSKINGNYVKNQAGATKLVVQHLEQKGLLKN